MIGEIGYIQLKADVIAALGVAWLGAEASSVGHARSADGSRG
jgi:hypothetical protein